jgi:hypothetical protein
MTLTASEVESHSLLVEQEIYVDAPLDVTFEALLEQLGPGNEKPDGTPMPFKLEAWPGGRWFRDLGDGNGHFWANVQAIKRPTLLEFAGPLFMSHPVANNVQEEHKRRVAEGWGYIHEKVRERAEKSR